jgi:hypothetical protein
MDYLRRGAKNDVCANRQYATIDDQTDEAERQVLMLTPREAHVRYNVTLLTAYLGSGWPGTPRSPLIEPVSIQSFTKSTGMLPSGCLSYRRRPFDSFDSKRHDLYK